MTNYKINDPTRSRYRHLKIKSHSIFRRFFQEGNKLASSTLQVNEEDTPAHGTYGALLFRPEWKAKRLEIIQRDKTCVICLVNDNLQVHHRQYHFVVRENKFRLPWDYPGHLLITLCENCHKRGHSKFKVPTINI